MVSEGYEMTDKIVNVAESMAIAGLTEYESQIRRILRRIRRHKLGIAGGIIVAILILSALLAPLISPNDPVDLDTSMRFFAPLENVNFLLGTDEMGRCTLSRLIYGGRISLVVGFTAMAATVFTGLLIGLFFRRLDQIRDI